MTTNHICNVCKRWFPGEGADDSCGPECAGFKNRPLESWEEVQLNMLDALLDVNMLDALLDVDDLRANPEKWRSLREDITAMLAAMRRNKAGTTA